MSFDEIRARQVVRFEAFVDDMLRGLTLPPALRDEVRTDFIAHLVSEFEARQARGVPVDRAVEEAIARFGSSDVVRGLLDQVGVERRSRVLAVPPDPGGQRTAGRVRSSALLGSFIQDVRYGLRGFRRSPGFALAAVLTLALGVGANTAVFVIVNGVLLRPLPYPNQQELVAVWREKILSEEMFRSLEQDTTSFAALTAYRQGGFALTGLGEATVVPGLVVAPRHFDVLKARAVLGRTFVDGDSRAGAEGVVVISYAFWQQYFGGSADAIGKVIDASGLGMAQRRIIGVLPDSYAPIVGSPRIWVPIALDEKSEAYQGVYGYRAIGRLAHGVTIEQASADVHRLVDAYTPRFPTQFRQVRYSPVDVVPLVDILVSNIRSTLWLLFGAVGFVLLIACVNVANLLFARSAGRRRELAVRMALGAGRVRIVRQMLTESVVLGLAGGLLGLGAAIATIDLAGDLLRAQLPRQTGTQFDPMVLVFTALVSIVASAVFGVIPSLRTARQAPRDLLLDGGRGATAGGRRRLSQTLVAAEVALALVLASGAALLCKSLWQLHQVDPGFEPRRIAAAAILLPAGSYSNPPARRAFYEALEARASAVPQIGSIGAIQLMPMTGANSGIPYLVEGQTLAPGQSSQVGNVRLVTPSYFAVMGLRLMAGRGFEPTDTDGGPAVAVVNRAFETQHWPGGSAVGRQVLDADGDLRFEIVGVVADMHQHNLAQPPRPEMYVPMSQSGWSVNVIVARSDAEASSLVPVLRDLIRGVDSGVPITAVRTMQELVDASTDNARFIVSLFGGFALLALCLGVVGVYGVVSYAVGLRRREMGVRVALGATPGSVQRLVLRQALVPVTAGLAAGLVLSVFTVRSLGSLLFEVAPGDPAVHTVVPVLLLAAGALASWLPARRASRVDPLVVLSVE